MQGLTGEAHTAVAGEGPAMIAAEEGIRNKIFWDGMPPTPRKKREKLAEKAKRQYMDLLSEEELEQIILSDEGSIKSLSRGMVDQ